MFEAKDGKKFGNAFRQKKYDSMHAAKEAPAAEPVEEKHEEEENKEGQHPVVQAHGKAASVHITHDHEAGKHHVHSHHSDGHENLSEHGSAQEAHEEGGKLAGVDAKEENPDEAQQGALSEEDGFQMPDLA
jgi:hypothetical protein